MHLWQLWLLSRKKVSSSLTWESFQDNRFLVCGCTLSDVLCRRIPIPEVCYQADDFKYGVDANMAGLIPAMLPFGTIFLTPLFGSIYDKYGKGATLMIIGSCLLTFVHVMFALPINSWMLAIVLMLILGVAFGLVPSAMWPSVPKIIPMKLLGTAYALIFYIQNIGLALIPVWIGKVNQANTAADGTINYTQTMTIFAGFGVVAILIAFLLLFEDKRKGYGLQKPNVK